MPIVTLTTDFGWKDHYAAILKGAMLSRSADLTLVDITHNIKTYDIVQAALILRSTFRDFPKGSIHVVSVNDLAEQPPRFVCLEAEGHFFVGPDNGLFSLVFDQPPGDICELLFDDPSTFPLKDIYGRAVQQLAEGKSVRELGPPLENLMERISLQPVISPSLIRGSVIYIDNYGNVMINISRELFERVREDRPFALYFKRHDPLRKLSRLYADVPVGEPLCLFNSGGLLEIAINMGTAAGLLGLDIDDTVQIEFE